MPKKSQPVSTIPLEELAAPQFDAEEEPSPADQVVDFLDTLKSAVGQDVRFIVYEARRGEDGKPRYVYRGSFTADDLSPVPEEALAAAGLGRGRFQLRMYRGRRFARSWTLDLDVVSAQPAGQPGAGPAAPPQTNPITESLAHLNALAVVAKNLQAPTSAGAAQGNPVEVFLQGMNFAAKQRESIRREILDEIGGDGDGNEDEPGETPPAPPEGASPTEMAIAAALAAAGLEEPVQRVLVPLIGKLLEGLSKKPQSMAAIRSKLQQHQAGEISPRALAQDLNLLVGQLPAAQRNRVTKLFAQEPRAIAAALGMLQGLDDLAPYYASEEGQKKLAELQQALREV